jgi:hypothetical protein
MSNRFQVQLNEPSFSNEYFTFRVTDEHFIYSIKKSDFQTIGNTYKQICNCIEFENHSTAFDSIFDWIKNNSEILKDRPFLSNEESIKIAELFLDQPISLEILLKLNLQGVKRIKQVTSEYKKQKKCVDVLFNMLEYDLISIADGNIKISVLGSKIAKRLLDKI